MSKPCPCYGPCLAGDDRCPLIAPDPVAALLRHERDSLATQLDDAKQAIVTLRATMEQMRRERDEARAEAERFHEAMIEARRGVGPDSERAAKVVAVRDALHAKLAHIESVARPVMAHGHGMAARMADVLRIIDEKEGGQ